MPVQLRPTSESDLAFVTALERRPDHVQAIGQWNDDEHLAAIRRQQDREHWIIERDGRPAGYLIAIDERPADGGIYLKRILVAEKGTGTGRAAIERFLDYAFARDETRFVWLNVRDHNVPAQALYTSLGFRRCDAPKRGFETPERHAFSMRIERDAWPR